MLVCVLLGSDLSESMVSPCSGVPCCVIVGWFNGKSKYKGGQLALPITVTRTTPQAE
jgi:hypothetical protein